MSNLFGRPLVETPDLPDPGPIQLGYWTEKHRLNVRPNPDGSGFIAHAEEDIVAIRLMVGDVRLGSLYVNPTLIRDATVEVTVCLLELHVIVDTVPATPFDFQRGAYTWFGHPVEPVAAELIRVARAAHEHGVPVDLLIVEPDPDPHTWAVRAVRTWRHAGRVGYELLTVPC